MIGRFLKIEGPWLAYCGLIFYLSSLSGRQLQWMAIPDVMSHFVEFGILGILSYRVFVNWKRSTPALWALAFCILFSALDEVHQLFVPQRRFEFKDMAVDFLGALAGIAMYRAAVRRFKVEERQNGTTRHS